MAEITRRIGLSLGADICWPICFEEILRRLDLSIPDGDDTLRFEVERVTIEPFDLRQPTPYHVLLDRLTHWYYPSREWIKKAVLLDGLYVFNNPWAVQSMEKHTAYCAMMRLGMPVPDTWMVPPKAYEPREDLESTLQRYAELFDLGDVGEKLGYPMFMKPYDGGAWAGVSRIESESHLRTAYEQSGTRVMHLQHAVEPFDRFVRAIGVGPQVRLVPYDPSAPLHERYQVIPDYVTADEADLLQDMVLTINTFFGWDFNSCESLRHTETGEFHPIDFANACPDSQVTSLHYHFPWLVLAKLRWALYCAATRRRMHQTLDWQPYYDIADRDMPYRERLAAYGALARKRLEAERFEEFCAEHLGDLDPVAREFLTSDRAGEAVRLKVQALFPEHEVEEFTELFWGAIKRWCDEELSA